MAKKEENDEKKAKKRKIQEVQEESSEPDEEQLDSESESESGESEGSEESEEIEESEHSVAQEPQAEVSPNRFFDSCNLENRRTTSPRSVPRVLYEHPDKGIWRRPGWASKGFQ